MPPQHLRAPPVTSALPRVRSFIAVAVAAAAEHVSIHVLADAAALVRGLVLIEPEMDAAINAGVGDVVSDLGETSVMEGDTERRAGNGEGPAPARLPRWIVAARIHDVPCHAAQQARSVLPV